MSTHEPRGRAAFSADPLQLLEFEDRLMAAHADKAAAQRRLLACILPLDAAEVWRTDGMTSMSDWLAYRLDLTHETAKQAVEVAHALTDLPEIAKAYADGLFSWEQLTWLVKLATPQDDADLAERAVGGTPARLRSAVRRKARLDRAEERRRARDDHDARSFKIWCDERRYHFNGSLPLAEGAVVHKALDRAAEKAWRAERKNDDDLDPVPLATRRADALVELASAAIGSDPDPDRATVVVYAESTELADHGHAELAGGVLLPGDAARRLSCDARLDMRVRMPDGTTLSIGRTSRNVPPKLMRELVCRDGGRCRYPGCRKRFLRAHHIVHWADGGRTDEDNLVLLCPYHHWLVHDGGYGLRLHAKRLLFTRPDGRPLSWRPEPLRPPRSPLRRKDRSRAP